MTTIARNTARETRIRLACPADAAAVCAIYAPYVRDTATTFDLEPPTVEEMEQKIATILEERPFLVAEIERSMLVLHPLLLTTKLATAKPSPLSDIPTLRHSGRARLISIQSRLRSILHPKRRVLVLEPGSTMHLKKSCAFRMCTTRTLASRASSQPTKRALPRAASSTNEGATFSVRTSRTADTSSVVGTTFSGCKSSSSRFHKNLKGSFPYRRWTKLRSQQFLRRHDLVHDLSFAQTMQVVV